MLFFVRSGDIVFVESISRLARNIRDLLEIIDKLKAKNIQFVSQKENIDTSTPTGKFTLTLFGALAELEREQILDRQREGIELAKQRGVYKGRMPKQYDIDEFKSYVSQWKEGKIKTGVILKKFDITSTTFYRWAQNLQN